MTFGIQLLVLRGNHKQPEHSYSISDTHNLGFVTSAYKL